ncbi:MAG: hypothetical protein HOO91_17310 [Bacteroidales bacterium]|nr:hypothetical protein [Bacteroidales bacterium]
MISKDQLINILITTALCITLLVGILHFFIIDMFKWFSYIPDAPKIVLVSIQWTNFFLSALITVYSLFLLYYKKQLMKKNKILLNAYFLFMFTWFLHLPVTILLPHTGNFDKSFVYEITGFTVIFILFLIPYILLLSNKQKPISKS